MLQLKKRRGAMVVMTGVMFFALVICGAVAIDFGRLWTERWELQSAADAGALAGALQLMPPRDTLVVTDSARAYVHRNRAMSDTITVDSVVLGNWNGPTRVWTPAGSPTNAVRVVVSQQASNLFMAGFGIPTPRMTARAIAWAAAPVATTTSCMKPWAIPYESLMYAINTYRGIAITNSSLTRPFDNTLDMAALQAMSAADRTFNLKLGSGANGNVQDTISQAGADAGNMPGNYRAVVLPKLWDYATQSYPYGQNGPPPGGNVYSNNISGSTCHGLAVGDSLMTETGNKVGPTVSAVEPAVCSTIVQSGANIGDCLDAGNNVGVDIKAAFYSCGTGCQGKTAVGVTLLGSFTLMKMYPRGDTGPTPLFDKAQLVGVFKPVQAEGGAGGGSTTLVKLLLVQ
jgi:Flp pilus assembly protein TadG